MTNADITPIHPHSLLFHQSTSPLPSISPHHIQIFDCPSRRQYSRTLIDAVDDSPPYCRSAGDIPRTPARLRETLYGRYVHVCQYWIQDFNREIGYWRRKRFFRGEEDGLIGRNRETREEKTERRLTTGSSGVLDV